MRRAGIAIGAALAVATFLGGAREAVAQEAIARETVGTLVVAHGANPAWNAPVLETARQADTEGPVEVAFLMGPAAAERRFQDAVRALVEAGADRVVVVPLFVSSHSGHYEQMRWLAGETDSLSPIMREHLQHAGIERPGGAVPLELAPALDDSPELARVLAERALALAGDPGERSLFLVGHGPNSAEDHAAWMKNLREVAGRVRRESGFADVKVGLVRDDAPEAVREEAVRGIRETIQLMHLASGREVVVVPILISSGRVSAEKIPADLAGLPIVYDGTPILPHPAIARWIESRVRTLAAKPPAPTASVAERAGDLR
ncbi:MAG TPA: CbiX/SirB N-terminal domain-containing protein [Gemmatimonadota bacterium]|nr:CbiX/SirB N-terminal domain-containing protein [Gemmatimonadota bacterium]